MLAPVPVYTLKRMRARAALFSLSITGSDVTIHCIYYKRVPLAFERFTCTYVYGNCNVLVMAYIY